MRCRFGAVIKTGFSIIFCFALLVGTCFAATAGTQSGTPLGQPVAQRTFSETTYDGYKLRASFRVYRPAHANAVPVLPYDLRHSLSCPVDGNTAAIPVAFTLTNTTEHANIGLGTGVVFDVNPASNISRVKFDARVGNKVSCITTTTANAAQYTALWKQASKPGHGERADLYVIVPGYYTHANPDGDRAYLHSLSLVIYLYADGEVPTHNRFRGAVPPRFWEIRLAS
jgi:hypothetical protein